MSLGKEAPQQSLLRQVWFLYGQLATMSHLNQFSIHIADSNNISSVLYQVPKLLVYRPHPVLRGRIYYDSLRLNSVTPFILLSWSQIPKANNHSAFTLHCNRQISASRYESWSFSHTMQMYQ